MLLSAFLLLFNIFCYFTISSTSDNTMLFLLFLLLRINSMIAKNSRLFAINLNLLFHLPEIPRYLGYFYCKLAAMEGNIYIQRTRYQLTIWRLYGQPYYADLPSMLHVLWMNRHISWARAAEILGPSPFS